MSEKHRDMGETPKFETATSQPVAITTGSPKEIETIHQAAGTTALGKMWNAVDVLNQRVVDVLPDNIVKNAVGLSCLSRVIGDGLIATSGGNIGSSLKQASGIFSMICAGIGWPLRNVKQSPEDEARLSKMDWVEYAAEIAKRSVLPHKDIRRFIGTSVAVSGTLLMVSGIETGRDIEMTVGSIILVGGSLCTAARTDEQGWGRMGSLFNATLIPLNVANLLKTGDLFMAAATTFFATATTLDMFVSGREKTNMKPVR